MDQTNAELTDDAELAENAPDTPAASSDDTGLDQPSASEDSAKSVDSLEGQLNDIQKAMDQLQAGDLDAAEATIEALEQQVGAGPVEANV